MCKKTKALFIILIVLFEIVLVLSIVSMNTKNKKNNNYTNTDINNSSVVQKQNFTPNVISVNDETYKNEVYESEKKVVVDFTATWCEPCKILEPVVDEVSAKRDDVKFVRIDIDASPEVTKEFKITSVPTIAIVENGEIIKKVIGTMSEEKLIDLIDY